MFNLFMYHIDFFKMLNKSNQCDAFLTKTIKPFHVHEGDVDEHSAGDSEDPHVGVRVLPEQNADHQANVARARRKEVV